MTALPKHVCVNLKKRGGGGGIRCMFQSLSKAQVSGVPVSKCRGKWRLSLITGRKFTFLTHFCSIQALKRSDHAFQVSGYITFALDLVKMELSNQPWFKRQEIVPTYLWKEQQSHFVGHPDKDGKNCGHFCHLP